MVEMKKLIMATNNEHKLREIRQILADQYEVCGLHDIGCDEDIPETAGTLEGNALQKARYIVEHYGLDCFADDTGLEVDALHGEPGVYTARFGQMNGYGESHDSDANIRCLLDKLKDERNRHARFRTVIALVKGEEEHLFEGIVEGEILTEKTGTDGFGYDPIFAPSEAGMSFAEMGPQEKNRISHRGRATQKLAAFLRTLVLILGLFVSPSLLAQHIGEWQVYPSYWIATQNVVVGDKVFSLMNGNLFCYDTEDTSVRTYNCMDDLNDMHISHIAYSSEAKRLILIYDNGNIDLMDMDDNVQNIASLKESTLNDKAVNGVKVEGSVAYIGTGFGLITVDMKEGVIRDTYRLGVNVQALDVKDGTIYIATNVAIYRSSTSDPHLLSNWVRLSGWNLAFKQMFLLGDEIYILRANTLHHLESNGAFTTVMEGVNQLSVVDDGLIYSTATNVYLLTPSGTTAIDYPNKWQSVSCSHGIYWASEGMDGLKGYKLVDGALVEAVGKIQPNSPVRDLFYRMQYVGDRLLVAGGVHTPAAVYNPATAMYYEDGQWTNFDEEGPAAQYPNLHIWNTTNLVQDPNDPDHHYASPYHTGLYEYRNGKFVGLYNSENSPLRQILFDDGNPMGLNFVGCCGLQYDEDGNLWMMNLETDTIVRILQPSGKWLSLYYEEIATTPTPDDYLFTTSGVNFLVSRRMEGRGFFGFDTNGTLNTVRDDRHLLRTTLTNQDGTSYTPDQFYCMAEDMDGRIWCGTLAGLFVINDATKFFDSDFTFEQIKIARNDGSGLADYLLSGLAITCIAVDGANRKWIGSGSNGLYLVSADGQELIHHFTAADSPLLSDNIQCLAIHPLTGMVMIGTDKGLCSYVSDATEPEDELDKDNVIAYPNPVRPDYTGPIAVRGLTRDGEVKICSSTGQLVWSGVSNGGTFTWNGQNKRGRRVASGVYHVIANTADGKKAVVSRIIVIH